MGEDLQPYAPLVANLKIPLPDKVTGREQLREMIAFAESYGVVVSEHRRNILAEIEIETADKLSAFKAGVHYDEEGMLVQTEEAAETWKKMNADEKKIMLNAEIAQRSAELEFVTNLENLIKRRTSLGQSILNSINSEQSSQYNN